MKKRMTRHERIVIFERVKTAVIIVLCLCCVYFLYAIMRVQRTSGIYGSSPGFMGSAASSAVNVSESAFLNSIKTLSFFSEPELIIINKVDSRDVLNEDNAEYNRALDTVNVIMRDAHATTAEYSTLDDEIEWRSALRSNSVYIKYPCARSNDLDAHFYEIKNSSLAKNALEYSEAVLIPAAANGSGVTVLIRDKERGGVVRIKTASSSAMLNDLIANHEFGNGRAYTFAFELKLDTGELPETTASLDSMLVIPTGRIMARKIVIDVPWEYRNGLSFNKTTDFTLGLINTFGYNPNTIRQYSDRDGALVFVGETGTLRVHPGGTIEYKALDTNEGISLVPVGQTGTGSLYAVASELIEIMERVFTLCGESNDLRDYKVRFTQIPKNVTDNDELVFGFDYFVDGRMLKLDKDHAVEAKVSRGMLTEMRMCVKTVEKSEKMAEVRPVFVAIDEFCSTYGRGVLIENSKIQYKETEDGVETVADWEILGSQEVR